LKVKGDLYGRGKGKGVEKREVKNCTMHNLTFSIFLKRGKNLT
jgi:hypothetical protein